METGPCLQSPRLSLSLPLSREAEKQPGAAGLALSTWHCPPGIVPLLLVAAAPSPPHPGSPLKSFSPSQCHFGHLLAVSGDQKANLGLLSLSLVGFRRAP